MENFTSLLVPVVSFRSHLVPCCVSFFIRASLPVCDQSRETLSNVREVVNVVGEIMKT